MSQVDGDAPPPTPRATPAAVVARTDREVFFRALRWILVAGYFVVLVVYIAYVGIPLDRVGMTLWILVALAVFCVGKGWRAFGMILVDWLPFSAVLIGYDFTRGLAGGYQGQYVEGASNDLGFPLHVIAPVHADEWLFGGTLPTAWLQEHLHTPGTIYWYDVLVTLVYLTHFLATPIIAAVLWFVNRKKFRAWVGCVLAMALLGVATYVVYPMAPPWLAAQQGVIDPVRRISGLGWQVLHLDAAAGVVNTGQALSNPVAAMPSLHTGYATLVALFFMIGAPWWRRILLACYPLLMGFALVYSGEHYVIDVVFGILYAAVIITSWRLIHHYRARRKTRAAGSTPTDTDTDTGPDTVAAPHPQTAPALAEVGPVADHHEPAVYR